MSSLAALAALPRLPDYLTEGRWLFALLLIHLLSLAVALRLLRGPGRLLPPVRCGLGEVLAHYKPGKIYDWHHANAVLAGIDRCFTIKLPHDPRIFGTVNPAVVQHVLIDAFKTYDKGPQWRTAFHDLLGDGIFNADGDLWRRQRKVASHEFSVRTLKTFHCRVFDESGASVVRLVRAAGGAPINVQDLFARYTLDSIGKVGFGVEVGCLDDGDVASSFARAFDTATQHSGSRFVDPIWKLKRLLGLGSERELAAALRGVHGFCDRVINERRTVSADDLEGRPDMLSRFMLHGFNDAQLRDQVINFVLAGRDTTAILLTWALFELAQHPEVVERLREEAAAAAAERRPSNEDARLGLEELNSMPYLKATITEVMRLHPSVPLDFKTATRDDVLPDGTAIRAGERVMFIAYSMGRLPELWLAPDRFDPARHLEPSGVFRAPSPSKFPVFLAGPRTCLGKDMAYMGAGMLLTLLLTQFDIALVDAPGSITYDIGLTLWTEAGVRIAFRERDA